MLLKDYIYLLFKLEEFGDKDFFSALQHQEFMGRFLKRSLF